MHTNGRAGADRLTLVYVLAVAVFAALYRLLPYMPGLERFYLWNLTPVGALALFAGSRLRRRWAWLVPVAVLLASDLLLCVPLALRGMSAFSWLGTPLCYASFAVYVLLGRLVGKDELSPPVVGGAALLGGLQFFAVSNFAYWLGGALYPRTLVGLESCYLAALPFYRNTLAGDLLYSAVIFGLHACLVRGLGAVKARQPA
jgi:hypothetical protein